MGLGICCLIGILFSKFDGFMAHQSTPNERLTPQQKEHLMLLGSTAGSPDIIDEAIKSGNIFDPRHMKRAEELKNQWEDAAKLFAPYFEKEKRINAERGKPKSSTYAHIEAQIGDLGLPTNDWFLRIETANGDFTDLKLAPYPDNIADCLLDACHVVPQFRAVLHRPHAEPVVIFSHA